MIDKHGECPNCKANWKGPDVFKSLNDMSVHAHKSEKEVEKLANEYGWTKENPTNFSNGNIIELTYPLVKFTLIECHDCLHVFDVQSGIEFRNLSEAKRDILSEEEEEINSTD